MIKQSVHLVLRKSFKWEKAATPKKEFKVQNCKLSKMVFEGKVRGPV